MPTIAETCRRGFLISNNIQISYIGFKRRYIVKAHHIKELPDNDLSMARVHGILQRMSLAGPDAPEARKRPPEKPHDDDIEDERLLDAKALHQSDQIGQARRTTAALWT